MTLSKQDLARTVARLADTYGERGRAAGQNLERWLSGEVPFAYPEVLARVVTEGPLALSFDAFFQVLPFGTGGRRGRVGYGPNRINPATIATTIQGHCDYLRRAFGQTAELCVVVANDVRVFRDLAGTYGFLGGEHPLLGVGSRALAKLACEVYAQNGVIAYLTDPDSDRAYLTTPELSFVISALSAAGGVNLSASHNPPDDNGVKVYDEHGSQPVPPADQRLLDTMSEVTAIERMPFEEARRRGLVRTIPGELHDRYLAGYVELYRCDGWGAPTAAPIVFTPLCGCGLDSAGAVLSRLGFRVEVPPSERPDGTFAAIPFRTPNPEIPQSTEPARNYATEVGSAIVLSSDPDADRIGLEVRLRDGSWYHFDGNQIASVLCYALMLDPEGPRRAGLVIETMVTTKILGRIAELRGDSVVIDDLLVGFKYVADVLKTLAAGQSYRGVSRRPEELVLAAEESHGVIFLPSIRDKDCAPACMVLAALHQRLQAQGKNLHDYYAEILSLVGPYDSVSRSIMMTGAAGLERKDRIMKWLRETPPRSVAGQPVERIADYWDERAFGPMKSESDRASRDVIQIFTSRFIVTVRPSGTEPKLKYYCQLLPGAAPLAETGAELIDALRASCDAAARPLYNALLTPLGLTLGPAALLLPDVIDLDRKLELDGETFPELLRRLREGTFGDLDAVLGWLRQAAAHAMPGADVLPALKQPLAAACEALVDPPPLAGALVRWART
jgi:phosphoglucomutase/phosphomannomutase